MWGCREPEGGGEIGRREGGHPLKLQRGTGKGETRQRAKEDARRTRQVLDQWEGREKLFGKKCGISEVIGSGGLYGEGGRGRRRRIG